MARVFALSEASYQRGSDYDIVMLYQVLLGRNPENSQVIQDHRANPFNKALHTFVSSAEFRDSVLEPISRGGQVRRHDIVPRPSEDQLNWLFGRTVLDDQHKLALRKAENWEQFFQILCSLDGFLEPLPAPAPRPPRPVMPFKPTPRPAPVEVAPPPAPAAAEPVRLDEVLTRLARIEQMLEVLTLLVAREAQAAAVAAPSVTVATLPDAPPAPEPAAPKVKPSSRRQAR